MDKEKVLDKIKKCLALGKSANEHEAAQALKQAQALMRKYEISDADVALSDIGEQRGGRKMAFKLAQWQWNVANMVADVFGCECYMLGKTMMFYGLGNRAEIAAYAFEVVYRQITAARRNFLKTCRARKPAHRRYLADQFCDGWMCGAWEVVKSFEMPAEEKAVMDAYTKKKHPDMVVAATRDAKTSKLQGSYAQFEAWRSGADAGKNVQLHHAMNGTEEVKRIGA